MDLGLAGRVIVITGGSSGIGLASVATVLAEGALVATCARDYGRLRRATAAFDTGRCLAVEGDVGDVASMDAFVAQVVRHFGRLDGVAAIAGHGVHGSAFELSPVQWETEVMGKVAAVLNVVRAARPHLAASDAARIVTITAPTAHEPVPSMAAISTARAAVAALTRDLALELAGEGIAVNAVAIGLVDTPRQRKRHREAGGQQTYESWLANEATSRGAPMRRAALPEEIARLIALAVSPALSYTTGSTFDATGGLRAR